MQTEVSVGYTIKFIGEVAMLEGLSEIYALVTTPVLHVNSTQVPSKL
jgi:hypothetical protein